MNPLTVLLNVIFDIVGLKADESPKFLKNFYVKDCMEKGGLCNAVSNPSRYSAREGLHNLLLSTYNTFVKQGDEPCKVQIGTNIPRLLFFTMPNVTDRL